MNTTLTAAQAIDRLDQAAHRATAEETAAKAIETTKTRLIIGKEARSVFFASLAMKLDYVISWDIETAETDGRAIYYNPDYINAKTAAELVAILAHECLHCCNKHFSRRGGRDVPTWNIACDLAINPLLAEAGFTLPPNTLRPGTGEHSDYETGLSAEHYYSLLTRKHDDEPEGDDQQGDQEALETGDAEADDDQQADDEAGDAEGSGEGDGQTGNDPGQCGGIIDATNPAGAPAETADVNQLGQEWSANVAAAQQAAQRRGTLPGGIDRLCGNVLTPAADWKAELREFINRPAKTNYNWKRPNRRHIHAGLYLPSLNSLEIGHIVAAIDTSESIGEDTLRRFASELNDIGQQGVSKITILYHDADVVKVVEWTPEDGPLSLEPCGGGGTDHKPVFASIENMDESPAVCILLTDLYSSFPADEPGYPVLWASTCSTQPHPFGERIDIPAE